MNCHNVEKNSITYLDCKLDARQRREVETHLASCAACRERVRQFTELWDILDEAPAVLPSAGFDAALRARVAQEAQRGSFWGWLVAPSPRLAIGVTALLAFSFWLSSLPPAAHVPAPVASAGDAEFRMIADLPVLEDYDVLADFDALSELSVQPAIESHRPGL